jgi:hypothetical protein
MAGSPQESLTALTTEREEKVHWVLKGGGRWGLELTEVAWSVRLDDRGRELFPAAEALALARAACEALEARGELERNQTRFRLLLWSREPW